MNQPRMPSPAILVAVLALVAALAGTAVAEQATTSTVTNKKFKKLKKRVKALEQEGQQPGPQGDQGQPGEDATNLFAFIRDPESATQPTTVQYGSGVSAVSDPAGDSTYRVTFNRSVANCVVQAASGFGDPVGRSVTVNSSFPVIFMQEGDANQIDLIFGNAGGAVETSFMITAFC
jgi:hypothetical protein